MKQATATGTLSAQSASAGPCPDIAPSAADFAALKVIVLDLAMRMACHAETATGRPARATISDLAEECDELLAHSSFPGIADGDVEPLREQARRCLGEILSTIALAEPCKDGSN